MYKGLQSSLRPGAGDRSDRLGSPEMSPNQVGQEGIDGDTGFGRYGIDLEEDCGLQDQKGRAARILKTS